jgi:hypothetical protein
MVYLVFYTRACVDYLVVLLDRHYLVDLTKGGNNE